MKQARNQLPLDLMMSSPVFAGINSARPEPTSPMDMTSFTGKSPELTLASMIVDDRSLRLGKTTWKNLLDAALATGHVEIYESEPGVFGLRKPGFRFGPIARVPAVADSYIRERLAALKRSQAVSRG